MRAILLLGLAALVPASIAWAHGADMKAFLTLDPPVPSPAQHALRLELLDFYNNKVPGAKMLVSVEARSRAAQASELREVAPGTYRGDLRFPTADEATLRVEANLPGGPWSGERRIRIGDRARSLQNTGLAMGNLPLGAHAVRVIIADPAHSPIAGMARTLEFTIAAR
ncbi:MAG: hypothetical protein ACT4P5_16955 [Armatimonadota bacterium]